MRGRLAVLVAVVAAAIPVHPARAAVSVLVIEGRGFGHGVGMAQEGAFWMASAGSSTEQVLGQFYPGTAIARMAGYVRVAVHSTPTRQAVVAFPAGGDVRDAPTGAQSPGFPLVVPPGGRVRLWFDGAYHAQLIGGGAAAASAAPGPRLLTQLQLPTTSALPPVGSTTTTAPPDSTTSTTTASDGTTTTTATSTTAARAEEPAPADGPVSSSPRRLLAVPAGAATLVVDARARRYRGILETDGAQGPLRLVNQLDVEEYLRGMGEVRDPRWPQAALRAQAIAARTYALRAMRTVGELCDDQRCQVYLGQQAEYGAMDRAVASSRGQVLVYRGGLASTVYSANGGGHAASTEEGFGTPSAAYPYLRATPYHTKDPGPWTVRVGMADLARRFGYRGRLDTVTVARRGPSGRALEVVLQGESGPKSIEGRAFDATLGLRSTLFDLRMEETATDPPPPPPPSEPVVVQALPEEVPAPPAPPPVVALEGQPATPTTTTATTAADEDDTAAAAPQTTSTSESESIPARASLAATAALLLAAGTWRTKGRARDAARTAARQRSRV